MITLTLLMLLSADPSSKTAEEVKRDAKATVDSSKRYATEKKDEFVARMQQRIDAAKADLRGVKNDAKQKATEAGADLDQRAQKASGKLDELGKAGGSAWSSFKEGVENAVDELEQGVKRAKEK
ncbi:MAG: hypothetical protein DI536_08505 [Archangium gephyra]|uniref:Uncharacterized protein n=1 Tax=Archangium gephyra TaxID=48 RepID=A0A2W5TIQ9_9BACT|nr:MAG: hypothetical protein DI536_08505 [Archangium gephyra]